MQPAYDIDELKVLSPDGGTRIIFLHEGSVSLGRSTSAELSFPEDTGLSRQHLIIERATPEDEPPAWDLRDLGSKNGTSLNGKRIEGTVRLKPGDRISAGHLVILYGRAEPLKPVVVFDPARDTNQLSKSATIMTDLAELIGRESRGASRIAASQISALIRAGNELAGHRPLAELFPFILDLSLQAVSAGRGVLMTLEGGELAVKAHRGEGFRISSAVRDRVLNRGTSVLVRDTSADEGLRERLSIVEQNIRTLMAVPLQTGNDGAGVIGIIYVDSPLPADEFTEDDLNLLTVMANVAAIRIEHARLGEIEQAKQILARDLEQAAAIQRQFLPSEPPQCEGLDVAGHNAACRTVGGDYFDFFPYGASRMGLVLGDVSGKGMPASLLMMGLQARVQVLMETEPESLSAAIAQLNRITSGNYPDGRFVTLFSCIAEGSTGKITYCNAGHNPPVIVRADGAWETVAGNGPVLGMIPSARYSELEARLNRGDTLVIYSDGLIEAEDTRGRQLGTAGLAGAVAAHRREPAEAIIEGVKRALTEYTGGAPASDDVTIVVARRL